MAFNVHNFILKSTRTEFYPNTAVAIPTMALVLLESESDPESQVVDLICPYKLD